MTSIAPVFNWCCGRATFFALLFTVTGIVATFTGHLTTEFVALIAAIQGLVFAHSWKQDITEFKQATLISSTLQGTKRIVGE